ncbi:MAG: transposase [Candidatus Omnitrophota bacterium]
MPYREVDFVEGEYYHIYLRGNEKRDIFCSKGDYIKFCKRLFDYATLHSVSIICYCLLLNHFHLLLRQDGNDSISRFIHKLALSYAMFFNKKYKRVGHLFQGPFKAKLIAKDGYLLRLSAYIHANPVKHNLCEPEKLEDYRWSSYRSYLDYRNNSSVDKNMILSMIGGIDKYRDYVKNYCAQDLWS